MNPVVEHFSLHAHKRVNKALEFSAPPIRIAGLHSSVSLALLFLQSPANLTLKRPRVAVFATEFDAKEFCESLQFFDPSTEAIYLPAFDVSPYSGLYPNHRIVADRLRWLHEAHQATREKIFVATVESLLQKTMPLEVFAKNSIHLESGGDLPPRFVDLLSSLGYVQTPTVEDVGTFSVRGGIIDLYSPANSEPYRIELFGDTIESIRAFNPQTQISISPVNQMVVLPAREVVFDDNNRQRVSRLLRADSKDRPVPEEELQEIIRATAQGQPFYGIDFLLPYFYENPSSPLNFFSQEVELWFYDHLGCVRFADELLQNLKEEYTAASSLTLRVPHDQLYLKLEDLSSNDSHLQIYVDRLALGDGTESLLEFNSSSVAEFRAQAHTLSHEPEKLAELLNTRISQWRANGYSVFIASSAITYCF